MQRAVRIRRIVPQQIENSTTLERRRAAVVLFQGGAVRINDQAVSDELKMIGSGEITADGVIKLSLGKKRHVLLKPV